MYTSHGHHIPGTVADEEASKHPHARCGGPGLCLTCSTEAARRTRRTAAVHQLMSEDDESITTQAPDGSVITTRKASASSHEYVDENTLFKVMAALRRTGLEQPQIERAIGEMQNAGILFREYIDG